jgi:ribosomal protein L4
MGPTRASRTGVMCSTLFSVTSSRRGPAGSTKQRGTKRYSSSWGYCEKSRMLAPRSTDPTSSSKIMGSGARSFTPEYWVAVALSVVCMDIISQARKDRNL